MDGLDSGTKYDVQVVSVQTDNEGNVRESPSRIHRISTTGYCKILRLILLEREDWIFAENSRQISIYAIIFKLEGC